MLDMIDYQRDGPRLPLIEKEPMASLIKKDTEAVKHLDESLFKNPNLHLVPAVHWVKISSHDVLKKSQVVLVLETIKGPSRLAMTDPLSLLRQRRGFNFGLAVAVASGLLDLGDFVGSLVECETKTKLMAFLMAAYLGLSGLLREHHLEFLLDKTHLHSKFMRNFKDALVKNETASNLKRKQHLAHGARAL